MNVRILKSLVVVAAGGLAAAGCSEFKHPVGGPYDPRLDAAMPSSNAFEWYQSEIDYMVAYAPGAVEPSLDEMVRLNMFIDEYGIAANDELYATVGGPLGPERAAAVVEAFALRGHRITPMVDSLSGQDNVVVTVKRVIYVPTACLGDTLPGYEGRQSMPFGCANALNLSRMVANPEELIDGPAATWGVDTDSAIGGIVRYRTGEITPLVAPEDNSI